MDALEPSAILRCLAFRAQGLLGRARPSGKGSIRIGKSSRFEGGRIHVDSTSSFTAGDHFQNCSAIKVTGGSEIQIGNNCSVKNARITLRNNARLKFGDGVVVSAPWTEGLEIIIDNGVIELSKNVRIFGNLTVRFGGILRIGSWTGIGPRTEIRCEKEVTIGAYSLISYDVTIFDTNAHSTDWEARRRVIEMGYPTGAKEDQPPNTAAIYIGDDVWIGKGAFVAKGASLGNRTIVGMGTNVGGCLVPPDSMVVAPSPRIISRKASTASDS